MTTRERWSYNKEGSYRLGGRRSLCGKKGRNMVELGRRAAHRDKNVGV